MRARNIKPGFFTCPELIELPFETRLLFAGLWCCADRGGRLEDRPAKIKIQVFPDDDVDVDALLDSLADAHFIRRYEVDGKRFIHVVNFTNHQSPHHRESESKLPLPPGESLGQASGKTKESRSDSLIPDSGLSDTGLSDSLIPDVVASKEKKKVASKEEKKKDIPPLPPERYRELKEVAKGSTKSIPPDIDQTARDERARQPR